MLTVVLMKLRFEEVRRQKMTKQMLVRYAEICVYRQLWKINDDIRN